MCARVSVCSTSGIADLNSLCSAAHTQTHTQAQAVELGVFNKCNTPVIYKKSATLAINSLRKEALGE